MDEHREQLVQAIHAAYENLLRAATRRTSAFGDVQHLEAELQHARANLQRATNDQCNAENTWQAAYDALRANLKGDQDEAPTK